MEGCSRERPWRVSSCQGHQRHVASARRFCGPACCSVVPKRAHHLHPAAAADGAGAFDGIAVHPSAGQCVGKQSLGIGKD